MSNMKVVKRLFLLFCFIIFVFPVVGCSGGDEPEQVANQTEVTSDGKVVIDYGHVPSISASEKYNQLTPLKNYLEKELDVKVNLNFASDYSTVIQKINNGEYDFATFGPLSYVEAEAQGEVTPLVKPVRFGSTSYKSLIITNKNTGIEGIEDLRNKSFAFVDKKSTSGFLFPYGHLKKADLNPETALSQKSFLGGHVDVAAAVWLENYDAGAIYEDARKTMDNADRVLEETRVVDETPPIPNEPWVFRNGFKQSHPELVDKLKEILLSLDEKGPREKRVLDKLEIDGFQTASDTDYDVVREYEKYLPDQE